MQRKLKKKKRKKENNLSEEKFTQNGRRKTFLNFRLMVSNRSCKKLVVSSTNVRDIETHWKLLILFNLRTNLSGKFSIEGVWSIKVCLISKVKGEERSRKFSLENSHLGKEVGLSLRQTPCSFNLDFSWILHGAASFKAPSAQRKTANLLNSRWRRPSFEPASVSSLSSFQRPVN